MIRTLIAALFLSFACAASAPAADWFYHRSYYSHNPVVPVQVGQPRPVGGPMFTRYTGEYFNSGLRQVRNTIRVGNTIDTYQEWDSWYQHRGQF
ncbi:MAG: hypothetical protein SFX18_11905 [Pirellulales bacterium]|nr:hypothetical protein [Pirellulales bacterium]